jgi:hypothetical protein
VSLCRLTPPRWSYPNVVSSSSPRQRHSAGSSSQAKRQEAEKLNHSDSSTLIITSKPSQQGKQVQLKDIIPQEPQRTQVATVKSSKSAKDGFLTDSGTPSTKKNLVMVTGHGHRSWSSAFRPSLSIQITP